MSVPVRLQDLIYTQQSFFSLDLSEGWVSIVLHIVEKMLKVSQNFWEERMQQVSALSADRISPLTQNIVLKRTLTAFLHCTHSTPELRLWIHFCICCVVIHHWALFILLLSYHCNPSVAPTCFSCMPYFPFLSHFLLPPYVLLFSLPIPHAIATNMSFPYHFSSSISPLQVCIPKR